MKRILTVVTTAMIAATMQAQLPSFPGAEGFGALATGGRESKKIVHVTNLNAEGAGSLAEALNGSDRIVVFDVGGVIKLSPSQMVSIDKHNNITVLGQTAPGQGITIYGNRVLIRNCSNIIFRYIRMRGSINMASDAETLTMDYAENVILDHCDISWGRWDNVHIKEANNITWQNCIISEGIDPQRFGAITDGTRNWTISHCLWINNHSRNPKMKCYAQMINSVVYNGGNGVVGGHSSADNYQDLINNYFIAGPVGNSAYSQWTETDHLYQSGNLMDSNKNGVLDGSLYTNSSATNMDFPHFSPDIPVTIETPEEAYASVIDQVGCSRSRDDHDTRLITHLKSLGTLGSIIDSEEDVNGIGTLDGGTAIVDTDKDGMSDEWETANGLNPNDASDAVLDSNGNGYLNIEDYANSLAAVTSFLMSPTSLKVSAFSNVANSAYLRWSNGEDRSTGILIEVSNDGENYTQIDSLDPSKTYAIYQNLDPNKIYYYRVRNTDGTHYSNYSSVVSINEPEGIQEGGGTAASTSTFVPVEGKVYRMINYSSVFYNSSAALTGAANYMMADNNKLTSTTDFDWQNPGILWSIKRDSNDSTKYTIRTVNSKQAFSPYSTDDNIATSDTITSKFNITYVGDFEASQSGASGKLSFYRINTPDNKGYQIRGKSATQWLWGNGELSRADMIFTFQEIDSTLVGLYTKSLKTAISDGESLLSSIEVGTGTLQYPEESRDILVAAIENGNSYLNNYKTMGATQVQIDSVTDIVTNQIAAFKKLQNKAWGECDASKVYVIYSYGTASNSGTTTASTSTARRYLADYGNGLVFRVGKTDANESSDTLFTAPEAQWFITPDETTNGVFYVRNVATGNYLDIAHSGLSSSNTSLYTVYNNTDNSKYAFTLYAGTSNTTSLSIGTIDDDSLGGKLTSFSGTANRTRLRWLFEAAADASSTGISEVNTESNKNGSWYNLNGQKINNPQHGLYIFNGKKILVK